MKIKRKCECGSDKFVIDTMTLVLSNVPLKPDKSDPGHVA